MNQYAKIPCGGPISFTVSLFLGSSFFLRNLKQVYFVTCL